MTKFRLVHAQARSNAKRAIDDAPDGWIVEVAEPKRTSSQNAKMWAMIADVARAKPDGRDMTAEVWKAMFMDACGHKPIIERSLDGTGLVVLGYKSSRLTKAEMAELIECIYEYGARHEVAWSEPVNDRMAA